MDICTNGYGTELNGFNQKQRSKQWESQHFTFSSTSCRPASGLFASLHVSHAGRVTSKPKRSDMEYFKWEDEDDWYSELDSSSVFISVTHYSETSYKLAISFIGGMIYREIYGDDMDQAKQAAVNEMWSIVDDMKSDLEAILSKNNQEITHENLPESRHG